MENTNKLPRAVGYNIATLNRPVMWQRSDEETWLYYPPFRYIFNSEHLALPQFSGMVDTISDLKTSQKYVPLLAGTGANLNHSKILVERHRDRGIGDLLFMTGPLSYLRHVTGGTIKIFMYALCDRGSVLLKHPALCQGTPYYGPLLYDTIGLFDRHWFVESITEYDEEKDQANVYDSLFKQIGLNPERIEARFKRPSMTLDAIDLAAVDSCYYFIYNTHKVDLRRTPYFIVAPFSHSHLRTANYSMWLQLIQELSQKQPVIILGQLKARMPSSDMDVNEFLDALSKLTPRFPIINLVGPTPLRLSASLIQNCQCVVTLDSGLLYVAQALRVPAISIWGTHNPACRIGYDSDYMELAIWEKQCCRHSPCSSYHSFPIERCPRGENQIVCEVLGNVTTSAVLSKVECVEKRKQVTISVPTQDARPVAKT